jgi:hypothetical protein
MHGDPLWGVGAGGIFEALLLRSDVMDNGCGVEHFIGCRSPSCLSGDAEEIDVVDFENSRGFICSSQWMALSAKVVWLLVGEGGRICRFLIERPLSQLNGQS